MHTQPILLRFFCIFLFFVLTAQAQHSANLVFWPSPISNSLTQNQVAHIMQDSTGALWFGTQEGWNLYDGIRVEGYRPNIGNSGGLATGGIVGIKESSKGEIWAATQSTLQKFERHSRTFETPLAFKDFKGPINAIDLDVSGKIWIANGDKLAICVPQSNQLFALPLPPHQFPTGSEIMSLKVSSGNSAYAAISGAGIFEISIEGESVSATPLQTSQEIKSATFNQLIVTPTELWISTLDRGIFVINSKTLEFRHITADSSGFSIPSNTVNALMIEGSRVWAGTSKGLAISEDGGRLFHSYADFEKGLPNAPIYSLYKSRDQTYWIGTLTGLIQARESATQTIQRSNSNLISEYINAIVVAEDESLWLGTEDGIAYLPPGSNTFQHINSSTHPIITDDSVMALTVDQNIVWLGTFEGGLYRFERDSKTISKIKYGPFGQTLHSNAITSLLLKSDGTLIVGTFGGGLSVLASNGDVIRSIHGTPSSGVSDVILSLLEDRDGSSLVGNKNGLARLSPDNTHLSNTAFKSHAIEDLNLSHLSNLNLVEIQHAEGNNLWVGSYQAGLFRVKRDDDLVIESLENLNAALQLQSTAVMGIHQDNLGNVWLSTHDGFTKFDPITREFRHFSSKYGLGNNEFNMGASTQTTRGEIYFGGSAGLIIVDSHEAAIDANPIEIGISDIKIMDRHIHFPADLNDFELILNYEDKITSVEFFAAEFIAPKDIEYAYRIQQLDNEWQFKGNERTVNLTTLPPGKYILELAAKGVLTGWNWNEIQIPIIVNSAWWASPIAYIIYTVSMLALLLLIIWHYRLSFRKIQNREKQLSARIQECTIELDNVKVAMESTRQDKLELLAVISHEIRTPLQGIVGMNELLLKTKTTPQKKRFAEAALNSGKALLRFISEILDFTNEAASYIELGEVDFDLLQLVDEVCYLQGELAQRKGLRVDFIPSLSLAGLYHGDAQKIRQIITNLLGNAIRFTDRGRIKIVTFTDGTGLVHIEIIDTSVGHSNTDREKISRKSIQTTPVIDTHKNGSTGIGLAICQNFVECMSGTLSIESHAASDKDPAGRTLRVELPLSVAQERAVEKKGCIALLTDDDILAGSINAHALLAGYTCIRLHTSDDDLHSRRFDAIIADELLSRDILDRIEADEEPVQKLLLTSIRSLSPRLRNNYWIGLHRPVTIGNLIDLLTTH